MRLPQMPVTHQSTPGKSLAPEITYISRNMCRWIGKAKRFSTKMKGFLKVFLLEKCGSVKMFVNLPNFCQSTDFDASNDRNCDEPSYHNR